ncbi:MAG: hypothetical protein LBU32_13665 [Clostridiales bacterium]|nr:hypothetical protein [Clostridiales bacterium]
MKIKRGISSFCLQLVFVMMFAACGSGAAHSDAPSGSESESPPATQSESNPTAESVPDEDSSMFPQAALPGQGKTLLSPSAER